ncbi:MAG: dihydrolipoyl dehydrogenase [Candidatus Bathyarchaeota archaeon]|nr:dihydrolipoyl dehydrogenase [Candidatus Bathyarchaeum tardum]
MKFFDLIVVGSGAGLNVLNSSLRRGLKCALIESGKMGGTCLTRGCIPSKVLTYPSDLIREGQHAKKVGINFESEFDWKLIADRMWNKVDESKKIEENLSLVPSLSAFRGVGEFVDNYTMQVKVGKKVEDLHGEKIVIASGARSSVPPIEGLSEAGYVTSDSFFGEKFPAKPWKSLVIIGGGVIACEFAHIFSALGTKIRMVEMAPRLVSTEEPEVSELLKANLLRFMEVYTNKKAVGVYVKGEKKVVVMEDVDSGENQEIVGEEIFVASGRRSNSDLLKPEKTGVDVDVGGWIKTNEFLETSMKNIWCIGDANGGIQLRHRANYDSEICVHNMFNDDKERVDYSATPWAIYSFPQIGHVGMTEKQAIEAGFKIYVGVKNYSSVAKGYVMGFDRGDVDDGFIKVVVSKERKILGAHVIGNNAAILVQPFVYLMNTGYVCPLPEVSERGPIKKLSHPCPEKGSFMPIRNSMIIHPSLNEVAAWVLGSLKPVNIQS